MNKTSDAESEIASGFAYRNSVFHVPLLGCVALGGRLRDEIQNFQLLISAEVIRKGVGEVEIIFEFKLL